jgi:hypothetical protein
VFFTRPLGKALSTRAALEKGDAANFNFAGADRALSVFEGASSGGGRASKTATGAPKKPEGGRGGARGGRGGSRGGRGGSGCFNWYGFTLRECNQQSACTVDMCAADFLFLFLCLPVAVRRVTVRSSAPPRRLARAAAAADVAAAVVAEVDVAELLEATNSGR